MKKFVLTKEYLTNNEPLGYICGVREVLAVANNLNTLMKKVPDYAEKILQVRNPNCLEYNKWNMNTDGSRAELVVRKTNDDAVRFIITEVEYYYV